MTALLVYYLMTDRKTHADAIIFFGAMKALKGSENAVKVLVFEADPVILHGNLHDSIADGFALYPYSRRLLGFSKLQRVADEILEDLPHLMARWP